MRTRWFVIGFVTCALVNGRIYFQNPPPEKRKYSKSGNVIQFPKKI